MNVLTLTKTVFLLSFIGHLVDCSTVCNVTLASKNNWANNSFLSISPFMSETLSQPSSTHQPPLDGKKRMCPYREYIDFNARRIPASLKRIECDCQSCMKMDGSSYEVLDNLHFCHPVTYPVPVLLERNCTNGMIEYESTTEDIVVACVCRSKVVNVTPNRPTCPT